MNERISHLNNKPLTFEQQRTFDASAEVVSRERANELVKLRKWQHFGVLASLPRPAIEDVTPEEDDAIRSFWMMLPGWTSWMTALELLARDPRNLEVAA